MKLEARIVEAVTTGRTLILDYVLRHVTLDDGTIEMQKKKPVNVTTFAWMDLDDGARKYGHTPGYPSESTFGSLWAYRGYYVRLQGIFRSDEERALLVKEAVWKYERRYEELRKMADLD